MKTIGRREPMPHIIVTASGDDHPTEGPVMFRERVTASDFESQHFAAQLVERLGWAVSDAHDAEQPEGARATR
jgi:hypothetical protein